MAEPANNISGLFGEALHETTELARKEFALFRTEISENLGSILSGLGFVAVALVFGIAALIWLTQALVEWLSTVVHSQALAALIVGGALALVAVALGFYGKSRISAASLAPKRTVKSLQRDTEVLSERVSG